jgi:hypothetical protein
MNAKAAKDLPEERPVYRIVCGFQVQEAAVERGMCARRFVNKGLKCKERVQGRKGRPKPGLGGCS